MAERKEKLVVVRYDDEITGTVHYRAAIQMEYIVSPYEAEMIPNEFIAGTIANELRRFAVNMDETAITERVYYAKGHPVCPCCHREFERGE